MIQEIYLYSIRIFVLALVGFLFGLLLEEEFDIDYYSAIGIMVLFVGLALFLSQVLLNHYLGLDIHFVDDFPNYLVNQFGGFVLALIFGAIWEKNFA